MVRRNIPRHIVGDNWYRVSSDQTESRVVLDWRATVAGRREERGRPCVAACAGLRMKTYKLQITNTSLRDWGAESTYEVGSDARGGSPTTTYCPRVLYAITNVQYLS